MMDYSHRRTGLCMNEPDFGEVYTLLELFLKTYTTHEDEVKIVLDAILEVYMKDYRKKDPVRALHALRNPRRAGRKQAILSEAIQSVLLLHDEGESLRSIAEKTGISKSSVQRILNEQVSHN